MKFLCNFSKRNFLQILLVLPINAIGKNSTQVFFLVHLQVLPIESIGNSFWKSYKGISYRFYSFVPININSVVLAVVSVLYSYQFLLVFLWQLMDKIQLCQKKLPLIGFYFVQTQMIQQILHISNELLYFCILYVRHHNLLLIGNHS